jgi:hypothetical protein
MLGFALLASSLSLEGMLARTIVPTSLSTIRASMRISHHPEMQPCKHALCPLLSPLASLNLSFPVHTVIKNPMILIKHDILFLPV